MSYTTDEDLLQMRQEFLSLGIDDWSEQHAEAAAIVDRALDTGWYRAAATERGIDWRSVGFDGNRLLSAGSQVKRLAVYQVLHLGYRMVARGGENDVLGRLADRFGDAYGHELSAVLAAGLDYDWDGSGEVASEERGQATWPRRLVRQ